MASTECPPQDLNETQETLPSDGTHTGFDGNAVIETKPRRMTLDQRDRLSKATKRTRYLRLGRTSFGRVVYVIDGNTVEVVVPFFKHVFKVIVRLSDTSVPSMRPSASLSPEDRAAAINEARKAQSHLIKILAGRYVFLDISGVDLRSRYLAKVYKVQRGIPLYTEPTYNDEMVASGFAAEFVPSTRSFPPRSFRSSMRPRVGSEGSCGIHPTPMTGPPSEAYPMYPSGPHLSQVHPSTLSQGHPGFMHQGMVMPGQTYGYGVPMPPLPPPPM
jgi:endonuclease YncB( thermonuclease family)